MLKFFRKKMKAIMIMIALVFVVTMLYGLGSLGKGEKSSEPQNFDLATVNGQKVDKFRFNQIVNKLMSESKGYINPQALLYVQAMALGQLIDFTVMQETAQKEVSASNTEVSQAMTDIMRSNSIPSETIFNQVLEKQGFTTNDIKKMIRDEITVNKFISKVNSEVTIKPDDLREVKAQHILIAAPKGATEKQNEEAKKLAEEIYAKVKNGENFSMLAEKLSNDTGSAKVGGDLGFVKKEQMVKEFDDAIFTMKPNEVSFVKTDFGYHIIKVNEFRVREDADSEKVLKEKRAMVFNKRVAEAKQKAVVVIKDPTLNAFNLSIRGDITGAIAEYKRAIKNKPNSAFNYIFLSDLFINIKDVNQAVIQLDMASNIQNLDPYICLYLGESFIKASTLAVGSTKEACAMKATQQSLS